MEINRPFSKEELKRIIKRFCADKKRGISLEHFCEIAGVDLRDFRRAFLEETVNISEMMQVRVSKAYRSYERGDIVVYQNWDRTKTVDYRRRPKPVFQKSLSIVLTKNGIELKAGLRNRRDYTAPTFAEHLDNLPRRKTW